MSTPAIKPFPLATTPPVSSGRPTSAHTRASELLAVKELWHLDERTAMDAFTRLPEEIKGKVFEELWRVCGRPREDSRNRSMRSIAHGNFGQVAFYGAEGRQSTSTQKMLAIELCLLSLLLEGIQSDLRESRLDDADTLLQKLPEGLINRFLKKFGRIIGDFDKEKRSRMTDPNIPLANKVGALDKLTTEWNQFRRDLETGAQKLEELLYTGTDTTKAQYEICKAIANKAVGYFVKLDFLDLLKELPDVKTSMGLLIQEYPSSTCALVLLDHTLADTLDETGGVVEPTFNRFAAVDTRPEKAHIEAMQATLPIETALIALGSADNVKALKAFASLPIKDQWSVFGEMWRVCGRPCPESTKDAMRAVSHPYFGENVFLDIPSDDGIERIASPEQKMLALELHRVSVLLQHLKVLVIEGKPVHTIYLLHVMPINTRFKLQEELRTVLRCSPTDRANYFRDPSVTQEDKLKAITNFADRYTAMREEVESLCVRYESVPNEEKIFLIRTMVSKACPFIGDREVRFPLALERSDPFTYARECLRINGKSLRPYLTLLEPALVFEEMPELTLSSTEAEGKSIIPTRLHKPVGDLCRSIQGANVLKEMKVDARFNPDRTLFTHRRELYKVLTGEACKSLHFRSTRVVSIGASGLGRECIVYNTHESNSPRLKAAYADFVKKHVANKPCTLEGLLASMANYIHTEVFPRGAADSSGDTFMRDWKARHRDSADYVAEAGKPALDGSPIIPIDDCIEARWGVCRHQALVACYFISKLMEDRPDLVPADGTLLHVRDAMRSGAHVWAWYQHPDRTIYHVDPMWKTSFSFSPSPTSTLPKEAEGYGESIRRQVARLLPSSTS